MKPDEPTVPRRRRAPWLTAIFTTTVLAACRTSRAPSPPRVIEQRGDWVVVPLMHAECTGLAQTLNDLIRAGRRATAARRGWCALGPPPDWPRSQADIEADTPRFLADPATNCILFQASAEDTPNILEAVKRLDEDPALTRSRARE